MVAGRGPAIPRLKRRFQLLVVGTLVFMISISFFILQPESFATNSDDDGAVRSDHDGDHGAELDVMVNRINLPPEAVEMHDEKEIEDADIPVEKVVQRLVEKYQVDLGTELEHGQSPWSLAAGWVTGRHVLPETAPQLGAILNALATAPIVSVDNGIKGTQLKLSMQLEGGQLVIFKPKWYERDYIVEGPPYAGRDRHNAEIAAFHLSRILGLRRTPLAVGRTISFSRDLIPVASKELLKTFYEENGEVCFYGKCHYCNKANSLCTKGDLLEGTVVQWLPSGIHLKNGKNPWRRTYRENVKARWEKDEHYCSIVRHIEMFSGNSSLLLDLIDTAVFDFLISNADRHHYEFVDGVQDGMLVILDNGKSFGNPDLDEPSILAPLYQCCSIRFSTWQRLLSLQNGILSKVLGKVLLTDPISPVLTPQHLKSLDRRLDKVLLEVEKCISEKGLNTVILDRNR